MLETFTLKKQLETTREELSHALYQSDASCRVIARLIKERDSSRKELEQLRQAVGRFVGVGSGLTKIGVVKWRLRAVFLVLMPRQRAL